MNRNLLLAALALTASASAHAQTARTVAPAAFRRLDESNSARIGVYLGENSLRDTAGVLVNSVIKESPADKAGIKEGDRIAAVDGVKLRMSRDDADDASMRGMMTRRLTRELDKRKPGDEVELKVTSGGSTRTVRVKTVSARDLETAPTTEPGWTRASSLTDRPALGISLGGSPSKRDTLGVFVAGVNSDGPAEKAGIVEGDRIARINGTDLRVQGPEAGDADMSRALINRFTREVGKLKAGDAVTLTVVSSGRSHEVKLTAGRAADLHGSNGFFFGDEGFPQMERLMEMPQLERLKELMPGTRTYTMPNGGGVRTFTIPSGTKGGTYYFDGAKIQAEVQEKVQKAMEQVRGAMEKVRTSDMKWRDEDVIKRKPVVRIRTS